MREVLLVASVALTLIVGCGASQAPASSTPSKPQFEAVTTDWQWNPGPLVPRLACPAAGTCSPLVAGPEVGTAHGIFKNVGASGSAIVTFSDGGGDTCSTVIPMTGTGQVAEASCAVGPIGRRSAPPLATVSYA